MTLNNRQKIRHSIMQTMFGADVPAGTMLKNARKALGLSREYVADRMGISEHILSHYENNCTPMPAYLLMQLFMFGLDFYAPYDMTKIKRATDLGTE